MVVLIFIHSNLDPFSQYDDFQVWEAVSLVGLKGQVEDRESGLDATVEECMCTVMFTNCEDDPLLFV